MLVEDPTAREYESAENLAATAGPDRGPALGDYAFGAEAPQLTTTLTIAKSSSRPTLVVGDFLVH